MKKRNKNALRNSSNNSSKTNLNLLVLDTTILCLYFNVPNKNTDSKYGLSSDIVKNTLAEQIEKGTKLVLPIATIIETGNHIAQIKGDKKKAVEEFANFVLDCLKGNSPWIPFSDQHLLFDDDKMEQLLEDWKTRGTNGDSIGDVSITQVANYYNDTNRFNVLIYTIDNGLLAYSPKNASSLIVLPPRRKRS